MANGVPLTPSATTPAESPAVLVSPLSAAMEKAVAGEAAKVPAGRRVQLSTGVSNTGVELGVGIAAGRYGSVGAYAQRQWGGKGWTWGARAQVVW